MIVIGQQSRRLIWAKRYITYDGRLIVKWTWLLYMSFHINTADIYVVSASNKQFLRFSISNKKILLKHLATWANIVFMSFLKTFRYHWIINIKLRTKINFLPIYCFLSKSFSDGEVSLEKYSQKNFEKLKYHLLASLEFSL